MSLRGNSITRWISPLRARKRPTSAIGSSRGQTAVEYLTYFAFFLLVAAVFSAYIFSQSGDELNKRSQERFKSALLYVAQGVRDANNLAKHADSMEVNVTLPVITKGSGISISGDKATGIISGNSTTDKGPIYYYVQIGRFEHEPVQPRGENYVTISK
ncbi:MAG: hypothetical protein N3G76_02725 [Candidatus Micrarchaeota archaeon]|nr:hypothetical protein [Candidatus Micrarchaeota archaeon]